MALDSLSCSVFLPNTDVTIRQYAFCLYRENNGYLFFRSEYLHCFVRYKYPYNLLLIKE